LQVKTTPSADQDTEKMFFTVGLLTLMLMIAESLSVPLNEIQTVGKSDIIFQNFPPENDSENFEQLLKSFHIEGVFDKNQLFQTYKSAKSCMSKFINKTAHESLLEEWLRVVLDDNTPYTPKILASSHDELLPPENDRENFEQLLKSYRIEGIFNKNQLFQTYKSAKSCMSKFISKTAHESFLEEWLRVVLDDNTPYTPKILAFSHDELFSEPFVRPFSAFSKCMESFPNFDPEYNCTESEKNVIHAMAELNRSSKCTPCSSNQNDRIELNLGMFVNKLEETDKLEFKRLFLLHILGTGYELTTLKRGNLTPAPVHYPKDDIERFKEILWSSPIQTIFDKDQFFQRYQLVKNCLLNFAYNIGNECPDKKLREKIEENLSRMFVKSIISEINDENESHYIHNETLAKKRMMEILEDKMPYIPKILTLSDDEWLVQPFKRKFLFFRRCIETFPNFDSEHNCTESEKKVIRALAELNNNSRCTPCSKYQNDWIEVRLGLFLKKITDLEQKKKFKKYASKKLYGSEYQITTLENKSRQKRFIFSVGYYVFSYIFVFLLTATAVYNY